MFSHFLNADVTPQSITAPQQPVPPAPRATFLKVASVVRTQTPLKKIASLFGVLAT